MRKTKEQRAAQKLANSGARRSYTLSGGTVLEVEGAPGFRLLKSDELRAAAIKAGLIESWLPCQAAHRQNLMNIITAAFPFPSPPWLACSP
jgi:hypothetical protein